MSADRARRQAGARGRDRFAPLTAHAPAKINLGLFVGPTRADGRHELVSVMQSISLCDELTLRPAGAGSGGEAGSRTDELSRLSPGPQADELICPGVEGPPHENLALRALAAFRAASGWDAPPVCLQVVKRVPVAAGLGGGSADAAAALRLAAEASGLGDERLLRELAADLGADVPAQVSPGCWLAQGVGERLQALPAIAPFGVLVLPSQTPLSTAAVYKALDRAGSLRTPGELRELARALRNAFEGGREALPGGQASPDAVALPPPELLHNDLQAAAMRLNPTIEPALQEAHGSGADVCLLSGSGPTVLGLFGGADGPERARRAAAALQGRTPAALAAVPVGAPLRNNSP